MYQTRRIVYGMQLAELPLKTIDFSEILQGHDKETRKYGVTSLLTDGFVLMKTDIQQSKFLQRRD